FLTVAESLLQTLGPAGALHLRSRTLTGQHYSTIAQRLTTVSRDTGTRLVINGRADIALAIGAPAIQLGRGALAIADVRRIAPLLQIGMSVHSLAEAKSATASHPDWLIAGHIYPTDTHPGVPGLGLAVLTSIVVASPTPVIAVGGITPEHIPEIRRTGAAGVAVISGIWGDSDPKTAMIRYL
ncbi:MAG TPA: thiamine phosphate synthase, partial [Gemmatimonadaceae bacterium]|nr:thiamine phosphate synthase [Gemmatimonadaceae bacterium]